MGNKNGESVWQFDKTVNWVNERGKRIKSLGDSPQFELLGHLLRKFIESGHWRVQLFTLWNQQRVNDRFRKKRLRRRVGILIWSWSSRRVARYSSRSWLFSNHREWQDSGCGCSFDEHRLEWTDWTTRHVQVVQWEEWRWVERPPAWRWEISRFWKMMIGMITKYVSLLTFLRDILRWQLVFRSAGAHWRRSQRHLRSRLIRCRWSRHNIQRLCDRWDIWNSASTSSHDMLLHLITKIRKSVALRNLKEFRSIWNHLENNSYLVQLVSADVRVRPMIRMDEEAPLAIRAQSSGGVLVAQLRLVLVVLARLDTEK